MVHDNVYDEDNWGYLGYYQIGTADDGGFGIMLMYIDPGTGSMLFTVLIGVLSAGIYGLRSSLIKLRFLLSGGRQEAKQDNVTPVVIFTDDKRYWNVFEPICDELEERGCTTRYLTASPNDPALDKAYEHVSCEFVGEGNKAFAKLNMVKADLVLSSTPGLDVYQWKRSRDARFYAHIVHAISDATLYRMFGVDYYDAVLLTGDYQVRQIRELERLRNLPAKELPVVGITYMDAMKARLDSAEPLPESERTVLLAPSWGKSAIFSLYGGKIVDALLKTGYHIIIRPHPQSLTSEAELMGKLKQQYPETEQLEWNFDNDNFEVLRRSDVMISDFSGVIFDFALVFDRPVIYTDPGAMDTAPYDACWLDEELWTFETLPKIGRQLDMDSLQDMKSLIDDCIGNPAFQQGRDTARMQCWAHQGEAAKVTVDYLMSKLQETSEPQEA